MRYPQTDYNTPIVQTIAIALSTFNKFFNFDIDTTVIKTQYVAKNVYERVAVGRKYPCCRLPRICLLWELLQSLFHVQMG